MNTKNKSKRASSGARAPKATKRELPRQADAHSKFRLYQAAVQSPPEDIEFFDSMFDEHFGARAVTFREDFCGTALLSRTWVETSAPGERREAWSLDLDAPTLQYARDTTLAQAQPDVAARVHLFEQDVLSASAVQDIPAVDLICGLNFSFGVFQDRATLRRWFEDAHKGLNSRGALVLEMWGGTEAWIQQTDRRQIYPDKGTTDLPRSYTYEWEQSSWDPITHRAISHISFEFKDGSRQERAFTYDWRMWTLPELHELLREAGYDSVHVYWHDVDGDGEFVRLSGAENQEAWLVYVVGIKGTSALTQPGEDRSERD